MKVVDAFDHFVVPVDDLVAAERFYTRVFGGEIVGRNGLNVAQRKRGAVPHTFVRIAGKRIGVYLQSEDRPAPRGLRGSPTFSFETSDQGLGETIDELHDLETPHQGPLEAERPGAARSVYFNDPAGNHFHVYASGAAEGSSERMAAVGYLELEAPDLEASVRFYEQALGLELVGYGEDSRQEARQATLGMPTGQLVILTEVPFSEKGLVMSRTVPGPHLGFRVAAEGWQAALAHLDALGIPHGDRGAAKVRRPGDGGTYMDDPAGNVIQFITDGME